MLNPSSQWTEQERLTVIRAIAAKVLNRWFAADARDPDNTFHAIEAMAFVADNSPEFLEKNRAEILSRT